MKDDDAPSIGARVRELREALGLSQEKLAALAGDGVDRVRIAHVEGGRNKVSGYALRSAIAKGFGLSLDDFNALVEGRLSVAAAVSRIQAGQSAA